MFSAGLAAAFGAICPLGGIGAIHEVGGRASALVPMRVSKAWPKTHFKGTSNVGCVKCFGARLVQVEELCLGSHCIGE
jgi:hypothetical protein